MSTDYRPLRNIRACQLFDGRLEELDVYEHINPETMTINRRCLTDGCNYLWAYIGDDDFLTSFTRYAPNGDPSKILDAVEVVFDTYIVPEHQPQYWGFDTQEEWDACWAKLSRELSRESRKAKRKFEIELLKYVRGEPNGIKPGTDDEVKAKIAKNLVEHDSALLVQVNRARLRCEIKSIYEHEVLGVPF